MACEQGITGLFLFLAIIVSVFWGIKNERISIIKELKNEGIKELKIEGCRNNYRIISLFTSSLIALLVCALISFPFYSLPTLIFFFLLLAMISSHIGEIDTFRMVAGLSFIQRLPKGTTFLFLLPFSIFLFGLTFQECKAYYYWDKAVKIYQVRNYKEACNTFSRVYNPLQYSGPYLQYYGKALYMNEEYQRNIEMLECALHFNSDEILYTTLGDSYKALKRYPEAEEAYLYASYMVPHKLYPQYLLANLYEDIGQDEKAFIKAEELLNKKIKVETTATEEILHHMRLLVDRMKNDNSNLR